MDDALQSSVAASADALLAQNRAILDTAVDAIITINERGVIQSANASTERTFQYAVAELLGKNVAILMPEPHRAEHDDYVQRYLAGGSKKIIGIGREVTALRKDGTQFPVHLAVSEFEFDGQRFFTGIVRDISDIKQVQEQLLQAERLAAIGEMVTGLAHESRNALQRAQACLDMLTLDLEGRPEQLDLTNRAKSAIDDLNRLYEEVRGYAAPIHLDYADCDLSAVWTQAWAHLSVDRGDRRIELVEDVGRANLVCRIDRARIHQVFRNILENAIVACPDPGCVTILATGNERTVRVAICDNGPGFVPASVGQVFQPFFTTRQKGTGLGMAIAKRIVETHGGRIELGPSSDTGAEVVISLPRVPAD